MATQRGGRKSSLHEGEAGGNFPMLEQITPLILTYNEAPNIGRTLERLRWARRRGGPRQFQR
jgi:hypothetical protein